MQHSWFSHVGICFMSYLCMTQHVVVYFSILYHLLMRDLTATLFRLTCYSTATLLCLTCYSTATLLRLTCYSTAMHLLFMGLDCDASSLNMILNFSVILMKRAEIYSKMQQAILVPDPLFKSTIFFTIIYAEAENGLALFSEFSFLPFGIISDYNSKKLFFCHPELFDICKLGSFYSTFAHLRIHFLQNKMFPGPPLCFSLILMECLRRYWKKEAGLCTWLVLCPWINRPMNREFCPQKWYNRFGRNCPIFLKMCTLRYCQSKRYFICTIRQLKRRRFVTLKARKFPAVLSVFKTETR